MTKQTEKELNALVDMFIKARESLLNTIVNSPGVGTKVYSNTIYVQVQEIMNQLGKATGRYAETAVPREYEKSLNETYEYFKKNNLMMSPPAVFAQLHGDAIYAVAREATVLITDGIARAGRQILRYSDEARDEALRAAGIQATGEKLASGSTVGQMQKNMVKKLQEQGFMTVQYGSGAKAYQVPLDAYASLVARSTTREAGNLARENQLTANGYDLVEMTTHYPTCSLCASLQGRVYSISGKDKRFPPLSRAFSSGYHNVHPNCRHSVVPFVESMQSEEEMQSALDRSTGPYEDTQTAEQQQTYIDQQSRNRQARQDLYQYERYKTRLGTDAPKTFSAFRRLKKEDGEKWSELQGDYRKAGTTVKVKTDTVK